MIGWIRYLLRATPFEKAYIRLYNDRITVDQFAQEAGIKDTEEAWRQLHEYRQKVITGDIADPRDVYNKWR